VKLLTFTHTHEMMTTLLTSWKEVFCVGYQRFNGLTCNLKVGPVKNKHLQPTINLHRNYHINHHLSSL